MAIGQNVSHIYIFSLIRGDLTVQIPEMGIRGLQGGSKRTAPLRPLSKQICDIKHIAYSNISLGACLFVIDSFIGVSFSIYKEYMI